MRDPLSWACSAGFSLSVSISCKSSKTSSSASSPRWTPEAIKKSAACHALDQVLDQIQVLDLVLDLVQNLAQEIVLMKIMQLDLKWVHMARYELKLKQVRGYMAQDHFQNTPDPKTAMEGPTIQKELEIKILPIKETRAHGKLGLF